MWSYLIIREIVTLMDTVFGLGGNWERSSDGEWGERGRWSEAP